MRKRIIIIMNYLDDWGQSQGYICYINAKTGLRHAYVVLVVGIVAFLLLFHALSQGFVLFAVGVLGPAYESFLAIESEGKDDDTKMLYYWVVLGCLMIIDRFLGVFFVYVPYFAVIKFLLIIALLVKDYALSKLIYDYTIAPLLRKYQVHIDNATTLVSKAAAQGVGDARNVGKEFIAEKAKEHILAEDKKSS